ncbi:hypothetical protein R5R35_002946 [Gryllus longicercus]|uniref:Uncharacterized protein n=1 Tax=Gryllus longicercus TaxID=2509291 RepID=A0AAN9VUM5_9ORTH
MFHLNSCDPRIIFTWLSIDDPETGDPIVPPEPAISAPTRIKHDTNNPLSPCCVAATSPELRECPHMGKFSVTGVQRGRARRAAAAAAAARRARGQRDLSGGGAGPAAGGGGGGGGGGGAGGGGSDDFMPEEDACPDAFLGTLAVGCASADTMEFRSVCTAAELVHSYSCHGRWEDNGTHFLITTPLSRRSHGARRLCFMYREADGGGVVRFSSSAASCRRDIRPGVGGGLAFNVTSTGQCVEIGSSSAAKATLLLVVSLAASVQLLALQLLTPR